MPTNTAVLNSMWVIPESEGRTPLSILKEQASALTEQTDGLLRGDVSILKSGEDIILSLDIVAPFVDNYRTTILSVVHPIHIYPAKILDRDQLHRAWAVMGVETENDFINRLKEILSSNATARLVSGLLAQSRAATV